jgi:hypothetical protein
MEGFMRVERHEEFRLLIDRSFSGEICPEDVVALRQHLNMCTACQKYENASTGMIAALGGLAFEATPGLDAHIHRTVESLLHEM